MQFSALMTLQNEKLKCFKDCFWIFKCKIIVSDINVAAVQLLYVNIWMHTNKKNIHMNMFSWKELHFVYHVRYTILYAHMCLFFLSLTILHMQFPTQTCLKAMIVSVEIMLDKGINIIAYLKSNNFKIFFRGIDIRYDYQIKYHGFI